MDVSLLLTLFHIIGVAIGVGGATVSDVLFFRSLADRKISKDELNLLHTLGLMLWVGLFILVASGLGFLGLQYANTGAVHYLNDTWFQAKMTIIAVLSTNAVVMHWYIFPFMKSHIGKTLDYATMRPKIALFATTGVVSITSWYTALVLGVTRGLDFTYGLIFNLYLVILTIGVLVAYTLLAAAIFQKPTSTPKSTKRPFHLSSRQAIVTASILGITLVLAAWYAAKISQTTPTTDAVDKPILDHIVCIIEDAPWFAPEILEIEVGDTVIWTHCIDGIPPTMEEIEAGLAGADSTPHHHHDTAEAAMHGMHGHLAHDHVHTHPILSISGPESFSSDFRPVGHAEEGDGFMVTFDTLGIYEYICPTHPYMFGIIAVGKPAPQDSLWPKDEQIAADVGLPEISGVGEIWVNTQFEQIAGQHFPGTVTVVDAETWQVITKISDSDFNNPHNLWTNTNQTLIAQTQWHADTLSLIDVASRDVLTTVQLGNAPAHVFPHPTQDEFYVTINNENRVVVVDHSGAVQREIIVPFGPHGIWVAPNGRYMSIASTLAEELAIIDLETESIVSSFKAGGLPLATAITNDSRYAMISLLLKGVVRFVDLETMEVVTDVPVGDLPIWPSPAPDGRHVYVPNTASATVSVIDLETLTVVNTIPVASGAHGIIFGPKADGNGHYGYVSHKYARVMGVIDTNTQELVGNVPLGEEAWGGNGILSIPNSYYEAVNTSQ